MALNQNNNCNLNFINNQNISYNHNYNLSNVSSINNLPVQNNMDIQMSTSMKQNSMYQTNQIFQQLMQLRKLQEMQRTSAVLPGQRMKNHQAQPVTHYNDNGSYNRNIQNFNQSTNSDMNNNFAPHTNKKKRPRAKKKKNIKNNDGKDKSILVLNSELKKMMKLHEIIQETNMNLHVYLRGETRTLNLRQLVVTHSWPFTTNKPIVFKPFADQINVNDSQIVIICYDTPSQKEYTQMLECYTNSKAIIFASTVSEMDKIRNQ